MTEYDKCLEMILLCVLKIVWMVKISDPDVDLGILI